MDDLLQTGQVSSASQQASDLSLKFLNSTPIPPPMLMDRPVASKHLNRVLVVDASPGVCQQVGLALSSLKLEVDYSDSVSEAYRMAQTQGYQLMIIDVALDDASGYSFCRTLAQDPLTAHIPIVAFTARKSWYSRVKVKLAGCRAYLPKPTRLDEFCRVIQNCMHTPSPEYNLESGIS